MIEKTLSFFSLFSAFTTHSPSAFSSHGVKCVDTCVNVVL